MAKKPELKGAFAKMLTKDVSPSVEVKSKKISRTYTYDPELVKELKIYCANNNTSITEVLNKALRQYINK